MATRFGATCPYCGDHSFIAIRIAQTLITGEIVYQLRCDHCHNDYEATTPPVLIAFDLREKVE